jgi:phage gp46-like protein
MVQPKYNPLEALERVKLMMKYDSSKTLNENREIIFEQANCPNAISEDEMEEICNTMWDDLQGMQALFIRLFYDKKGNAKQIFETINGLIGKNYKDDLSNVCEPAIKAFKRVYQERAKEGGWFGFSTDGSIVNELNNLKKDANFAAAGNKAAKYIDAAIQVLKSEKSFSDTTVTPTPTPQPTGTGWDKFYCVPNLANAKGVSVGANNTYIIDTVVYFANGRKKERRVPNGRIIPCRG